MAKSEKKASFKSVEKDLLQKLSELDPTTKEYADVVEALNTLREAQSKGCNTLSKDALLKCATYVGVGAMMLLFEVQHPITTKLLSLLPKPKM